jgi:hypothetical protein
MADYYNNGKWKTFLKENVRNPVKECGEDMSASSMPPVPPSVPIPSDDVDPMALGVELGGLGLDPAMAQGVVDLLLSKGLLDGAVDPVDPVGVPPMMESGGSTDGDSWGDWYSDEYETLADKKFADSQRGAPEGEAGAGSDPLAQYSEEAVEAAKAALEAIPDAGAHSGAALENEIHYYLEQGFGETKRPREIFKIGDEALSVAGVILGLGPDAL